MLIIRLSRVGKRNHPQYKIVVAEKTAPAKGRFVEQLGSWNPHQKVAAIKADKVQHWLSKGASCSDTVWNLLVSQGIIKGEKRKLSLPAKKVEEGTDGEVAEAGAESAKVGDALPKEEQAENSKEEKTEDRKGE